jgi:hypothetical protein
MRASECETEQLKPHLYDVVYDLLVDDNCVALVVTKETLV